MQEFQVEITETLQRTVTVMALDEDDAFMKVRKIYKKSEIILDSEDYIDTEFKVL